jgi:hypothetical protein
MKGRRPERPDRGILDFLADSVPDGARATGMEWAGSDGRHFDPVWQAQCYDEERITDVKEKLYDQEYIEGAVSSIASLVSSRLVKGSSDGGRKTRG